MTQKSTQTPKNKFPTTWQNLAKRIPFLPTQKTYAFSMRRFYISSREIFGTSKRNLKTATARKNITQLKYKFIKNPTNFT